MNELRSEKNGKTLNGRKANRPEVRGDLQLVGTLIASPPSPDARLADAPRHFTRPQRAKRIRRRPRNRACRGAGRNGPAADRDAQRGQEEPGTASTGASGHTPTAVAKACAAARRTRRLCQISECMSSQWVRRSMAC